MNRSPSESSRFVVALAWRFFRGRGNALLDGTARAALIGITLGVTAMVVAMALMSGYRQDLRRKLIRGNAAVIAYPILGREMPSATSGEVAVAALEGVTAVRRVVYGQGSLVSASAPEGVDVTLRGVDSAAELRDLGRVDLDRTAELESRLIREDNLEIVVGSDLADRLALQTGDAVRLMIMGFRDSRPRFEYRTALVAGTFTTGFSEFDQQWLVTDRLRLEAILGAESATGLLKIAADDPDRAEDLSKRVEELLGSDYLVTSWQELNQDLFTALKVQQVALFFVLGLIVIVSTFNVASSLVVLVRERMRDMGVLAALGLRPKQLRSVFLLYGVGLGALGCVCGLLFGTGVAWVVTEFELIRFDVEMAAIYFISSVPFKVRGIDIVAIIAFTLLVTVLACWIPAQRAARIRPARALRYE